MTVDPKMITRGAKLLVACEATGAANALVAPVRFEGNGFVAQCNVPVSAIRSFTPVPLPEVGARYRFGSGVFVVRRDPRNGLVAGDVFLGDETVPADSIYIKDAALSALERL